MLSIRCLDIQYALCCILYDISESTDFCTACKVYYLVADYVSDIMLSLRKLIKLIFMDIDFHAPQLICCVPVSDAFKFDNGLVLLEPHPDALQLQFTRR